MNPGFRHDDGSNTLIQSCKAVNNKTVANVWTKLVWVVKSAATLPSGTSQNTYFTGMNSNVGVSYQFKNLKIEKGNTATDWTPAPEDYVSLLTWSIIFRHRRLLFLEDHGRRQRRHGLMESICGAVR